MPDVEITDEQVAAYDEAWQKSMRNDGVYDLATRAGLAAFAQARDRHVAAKALREAAEVCRHDGTTGIAFWLDTRAARIEEASR